MTNIIDHMQLFLKDPQTEIKILISLHTCAPIFELPSDISTMDLLVVWLMATPDFTQGRKRNYNNSKITSCMVRLLEGRSEIDAHQRSNQKTFNTSLDKG